MALGEKIAAARKASGLSQEQLGELLGVSRQAVSKWETNQTKPELDYLVRFAEHFNLSIDSLLRDHEADTVSSESLATLSQKNLRFRLGVFLTCLGLVCLVLIYLIHPQGYSFDFGLLYIYGFAGWLLYNKLALVAFLALCTMITAGVYICIRQAFPKRQG